MSWINKIKNKTTLLLGVFMSQLLLISNAFAAFGFAEPSANDLSVSFLSKIFGGLTGGGTDAFGASIGTFNGAILTVGGILAAYTILAGTLGTAHDGEMLGKKFSSVWVPIRYALGTALVLPILSGGYCVMQAIVMWVVMQGISLGNMAWTEYVKAPPLVASISAKSKKAALDLVVQTYIANVCVEAHKKAIADSEFATDGVLKLSALATYGSSTDADGNYLFGNQKYPNLASNCGVVSVPKKPEAPTVSAAPTGGGTSTLSGLSAIYKSVNVDPIRTAHVTATGNVVSQTQALAANAINNPESVTFPQLEAIAASYVQTIQSSATSTLSSATASSGMAAAAAEQGWFLAGSWFTKIINAQNTVNSAAADVATGAGMIAAPISVISTQVSTLMAKGHTPIIKYNQDSKALTENPDGKGNTDAAKTTETGVKAKITQFFTDMMTGLRLDELKTDTRHPIILMNAIGNNMIDFFSYAMLAGGAAVGVASFLSLGAAGATATIVSSFLIAPLAILFTTGISLAYILPNLPLLIWMGIIIGWTIMVVEAIVAAPLWAVMHLHPNGDDLTGRGGNGYMLVLGLLLRPVLIIFGFIAAIVLSGLFGEFVNKIYFETFASSQIGGVGGFFATIAGTAIYAVIMYTVLTKTLNLMHVIPDQLMRWIGGGGEQLGQYAGGFSGEGMAKTGAAVGAVSGALGAQGFNSAAGALGNLNQAYQAKKGANAQIAANKADKIRSDQLGETNVGTDGGAVYSAITQQNGKNEQGASAEKGQFAQTSASLGGAKSETAKEYRNSVAVSMTEDGKSFSEAHKIGLDKALGSKFGESSNAFGAATQLSGGATSGPKFNNALGALNKTMGAIQSAGKSDAESKDIFKGVIDKASSNFKQEGGSFAGHLQSATNEMKQELGISKSMGAIEGGQASSESSATGSKQEQLLPDSGAKSSTAIGGTPTLKSGDEE